MSFLGRSPLIETVLDGFLGSSKNVQDRPHVTILDELFKRRIESVNRRGCSKPSSDLSQRRDLGREGRENSKGCNELDIISSSASLLLLIQRVSNLDSYSPPLFYPESLPIESRSSLTDSL